jgi:non-ribosomal peptide synthetase component F
MAVYFPEVPFPLNDDSLSYGYEAIREMLHTRTTRPIKPVASFLNFGSIPEMFYVQVAHNPASTAFIRGNEAITYAQLAERANQIAKHLLDMKIGLGDVVGISLERSFDMVAALIAVLQTGAAYLPLDPGYPQERLVYIRQDAGVQAIIATRATLEKLKVIDTKTILLDTLPVKRNSRTYAPSKTLAVVSPDAPAYLIYTSGSTGKPKGVVVPHRQIVNRFQWMWQAYPFEPQEVGCQRTALNFVDSIWEIFGYL